MRHLYIRNLIFTVLQPGIVAGYVPYLILKSDYTEGGVFLKLTGGLIGLCGLIIMLMCINRFTLEGEGTLSPADPTKQLVINGLYQYSRNPMYVGVMGILIGETIFFKNYTLLLYAVCIFIAFNLFIILREEPRLKRDFGDAYLAYCKRVRRWF